jgi:hypothetical protein
VQKIQENRFRQTQEEQGLQKSHPDKEEPEEKKRTQEGNYTDKRRSQEDQEIDGTVSIGGNYQWQE